ncbi:S8 family serine peptidase [Streptococcus iniae]|uniref:Peptidase S8 n=2 Tax=Streptococcus iniae TaxID=1346 RepID=B4YVA3_STRIN|nr:S8 family serine peptidase [Streptococcus iniae]ACF25920.1 ScpI [Streptococcus iniae]EKB52664.1 C5a peptidase ScpB [Streptococcus iniae 9117]ELY5749463.1 S8 family serine peptidase [Streptococcus iniae]ELY5751411.1 S8 family serine peptidase [Streptococcus iniae]ESR09883.1 peptidase S8 [Streptococcus iniae IUSA1]
MKSKVHSKKLIMLQLSLAATSVLLTHVTSVSAAETTAETAISTHVETVGLDLIDDLADVSETVVSAQPSSGEASVEPVSGEEQKPLIDYVDPSNVKDIWEKVGRGKGSLIAVIDAGIEQTHDMLNLADSSDLKYSSKEDLEAKKKEHGIERGKWVNHKLVFYHDYNEGVDSPKSGDEDLYHGTHVAGIAAGSMVNNKKNELLMEGIAPDAQLMFMRVGKTSLIPEKENLYALAIEDAVALGATAINMSFGSVGKASDELKESVHRALNAAREKGVALIVAAGNDFAMGGYPVKPLAKNPDFGVIGTPATTDDVLTIAAYVAPEDISEVFTVASHNDSKELAVTVASAFPKGRQLDFIDIGKGLEDDYLDKDVKGKIVIVDYEAVITSKATAELAQSKGVAGVLVHHRDYKRPLLPLNYHGDLPMGFISLEDFDYLKSLDKATLTFNHKKKLVSVPGGRQMANFSSWGLSADGHMKPDLSAPGYELYSPSLKNTYEPMSGTSSASPHAMGIVSLVQEHVKKKYPQYSPQEQLLLVKNILMSTADPIISPVDNTYYSPRLQGAGAIDAKKAIATDVYLTGSNGLSKINLGDISNTFDLKVRLHNMGNQTKQFKYYATVLADKAENGKMTLRPQKLYTTEQEEVILAPNEEKEVSLTIDISNFDASLIAQMINGYFVDGFVHFDSNDGIKNVLSIPFLGFKGTFADLEALDSPIYNSLDGTFYYTPEEGQDKEDFEVDSIQQIKNNHFTGLVTTFTPWSLVEGKKIEGFDIESASEIPLDDFLGSYVKDGDPTIRRFHFKDGKAYLAISPNGDNNMDSLAFKGIFLRNVKDIKAQVFASDHLDSPIWESQATPFAQKHVNTDELKEGVLENTKWDGKDSSGNIVKEGEYVYRITYTPIAKGAKEQSVEFTVLVDLTLPEIPENILFDSNERTLDIPKLSNSKSNDVYRDRLYYRYGDESVSFTFFDRDENGQFKLPEEIEDELSGEMISIDITKLDQFFYVLEDRAGNYNVLSLEALLKMNQMSDGILEDHQEQALPESDNPLELDKKTPLLSAVSQEVAKEAKVAIKTLQAARPSATLTKASQEKDSNLPVTNDSQKSHKLLGSVFLISALVLGLVSYFKRKSH